MGIKKNYEQTKHKILILWQDVLKLIAIEEEILERLRRAESKLDRLNLTLTHIEKHDRAEN
jgi:hypothetical protein